MSVKAKKETLIYVDSTHLIVAPDRELCNPDTTSEHVQELFEQWWDKRTTGASVQEETYAVPVKIVDRVAFAGIPMPRIGVLHFPKAKLSDSQIEMLKRKLQSP